MARESITRENLKDLMEDNARLRKQSIKISSIPSSGSGTNPPSGGRGRQGSTFLNVLRRGSKLDNPTNPVPEKKPIPKKSPTNASSSIVQEKKKQLKLAVGKYLLGEGLGRGQFGQVFRGVDSENGSSVAIKQMKLEQMDESSMIAFEAEVELLKKLNHENVVKYYTSVRTADHLNLVIEYADGGSITSILKKFGSLPEKLCAVYIYQCLKGLEYLHSQGVVHRDIKGANLLLNKDGKVKLADFGISTTANTPTGGEAGFGSPYWMAPEVIEMEITPNEKADIWSLGCTIIELHTGHPPFHEYHPMGAIVRCVQEDHPPLPPKISSDMEDLLLKCFQKDINVRASAKELLNHPWFDSVKKEATSNKTTENQQEKSSNDDEDNEEETTALKDESDFSPIVQPEKIKFNGESIRSDAPFKTIYLTRTTTCSEVVQILLDKYHSKSYPSLFSIYIDQGSGMQQLEDSDCPVSYLQHDKEIKFFIRPKSELIKKKEGLLHRFGKKLLRKAWIPTRIVVDAEQRYIAYYRGDRPNNDREEPIEVIYNLKMVTKVFENINDPHEGIYEFVFIHRGEKHILRAVNNEEMTSWIDFIKSSIKPVKAPQVKDQDIVKKDRESALIDPKFLGLNDGKRGRLQSSSSNAAIDMKPTQPPPAPPPLPQM